MRILMLTCYPGIRGPFPKVLPLLANTLRSFGCHVEEEPWGRHSDQETRLRKVLDRPGDIWRVWRKLKRERFDVLFIHTTTEWANYSRDLPVLWLCRKLVKAVVLQFHGSCPGVVLGDGNALFKSATRAVLDRTDAVFVLSSEEHRAWKQFWPQGEFPLVCNPFASNPTHTASPSTLQLPHDLPMITFVGRLIVEKGIYDLLDAFAAVQKRTPSRLLVVGEGPEEERFRSRVKQLELSDRVMMTGYLKSAELAAAYNASMLFVLPSWSEGFPTVLTEAMQAGLPVVTTRIRGALDHLENGKHARFVTPKAPHELGEAIHEVLNDAELRTRMSAANRAKVLEFSPAVAGKTFLNVLEALCPSGNLPAESAQSASMACTGSMASRV